MQFPLFSWRQKTRTPRVRRTPSRNRPSLEILEARELLALTFLSQPLDTASGQLIKPFQVQSISGAGAITVSLIEQSSSGTPILGGTVTRPTSGGIATFNDLYVYGGTATDANLIASSGADVAVSGTVKVPFFQVKSGSDHLYISSTIPTTTAGASLGTITVQELDASGSIETNDSPTTVQLFFQENPGGAQFLDAATGDKLGTAITATLLNGLATFTSPNGHPLAVDRSGIGYTLGVAATNKSTLLPGTSNPFVITAAAPADLAFLVQPTFTDANVHVVNGQAVPFTINQYQPNPSLANTWGGVVVAAVDRFGNQVPGGFSGGSVTMTTTGAFNQSATTTRAIDPSTGVAAFTDLQWTGNLQQLATITNRSTTIKVQDANQLAVGMAVVTLDGSQGLPAGTTIQSIDQANNEITVSSAATDTRSGITLAFNFAGTFTLTATARDGVFDGSPVTIASATSDPFDVAIIRRNSLAFETGFAPPATAALRTALPVIKVNVLDLNGNVVTTNNTDQITASAGGIIGTRTRTVVNGVATFDDLALAGQALVLANGLPADPLTLTVQFVNQALNTLTPQITLTPGPAYNLRVVNRNVGTGGTPLTAGTYITDSNGQPLEVEVVDQDNNVVNDNTTIVSIGLLPNEGRGPVFVGNGLTPGASTPIPAPTTNLPGTPNSFDFQATGKVVNGRVKFPDLYTNFVGSNYILSVGTASFATHAGADTEPFTVVAAAADHLVFANQVNTTSAGLRFNTFGPIVGLSPVYHATNGLLVAAFDKFGNIATSFTDNVQLTLNPVTPGAPGTLAGVTTVKAVNGFAVFNGAYVDQIGGPFNYTVTARDADNAAVTPTNGANAVPFTIEAPPAFSGSPGVAIDTPGPQQSGVPFPVMVHVQNGGVDTNQYVGVANVALELRDASGNPLSGQATFTFNPGAKPDPLTGIYTFSATITLAQGVNSDSFTLLALLDLHAQTALTNVFSDPIVSGAAALAGAPRSIVSYGLGSLTTNFDTVSSFPVYQSLPTGGQSFPPVVGYDPAVVTATRTPPALQQPNVADGFNQVPQSSKWWSSLIFPRSKVAGTDTVTPQDSQGNHLFALNANPLTALVNSNGSIKQTAHTTSDSDIITVNDPTTLALGMTVTGTGVPATTTITAINMALKQITVSNKATETSPTAGVTLAFNGNFAGLGLSYLTDLFVQSSRAFNDPPPPFVPAGQPQAWANPQAPGAERWQYKYDGNGNARLYQDFAIGLQGVQADGKVLRYSDWTATFAWQGKDLSNNPQQLQATLGQGLPFAYFTVPTSTDANGTTIQLVTSPKNNFDTAANKIVPANVTVTAYDSTGKVVTNGTGAFELEIRYTLQDVLDQVKQTGTTTAGSNIVTVQDSSRLTHGMTVTGLGLPAGTTITDLVDATHIKLSTTVVTGAAGNLTFDVTRTFNHFYGIYLPSTVSWDLATTDANGNATFTARLSSRNYFSVATLPGGTPGTFNPAFTTYLPHAYTFVTGSTSSFNFDPSTGKVTTTYALQTNVKQEVPGTSDTGPLQALNATQYNNLTADETQVLKNFNTNGSLNYVSPHGKLLVWNGPVFHTQLQYTGILPSVPPLPNGGQGSAADLWKNYLLPVLQSVSSQAQSDGRLSLNLMFPNDNNYLQAQSMYGASQLVPMLLEISQSTDPGLSVNDRAQAASYAEQVYNAVKDRMGSWLSVSDDQALQLLYYQPATPQETNPLQPAPSGSQGWQSLLSILSGFLSSETLNDHQLIAGYFIKTAAFLAQYDGTWSATTQAVNNGDQFLQGKMGDIVNLMIGDVSNYDRGSTIFPFLRNFDVYAIHSWADGAANDNVGTNLESSSEALNYASALIQWGQATGNRAMRDLGVYLYTTELEGVNSYWFSIKNKTDPFGQPTDVIPPAYLGSAENGTQRTIVTKLNSNGGASVGFIGFQTSRVAGIQFLPFSGSAYYLGQDPSFVTTTYALAQQGATAAGVIPVLPPTYQSLLLPYLALSDPTTALNIYKANINQIAPVNPNDLIDNNAFNIHWMQVLQAYGQVDASVTADTVSYTVFKQPGSGARTFVAYNPDVVPATVHFKDGMGNLLVPPVTVPPRSTGVFDVTGKSLAQQTTPNYALKTPANRFFLTTNGSGQSTLSFGKPGTGEKSVFLTNTGPLQFTLSGLTGTLQGQSALPDFQLWFDQQFRSDGKAPVLDVTLTINDGFGHTVTQTYSNFAMPTIPGYVLNRSQQGGGLVGGSAMGLPTRLVNGSVTVSINARENIDAARMVRLRTDAAAQQGRVSFLDLPYDFTTVGGQSVTRLSLGGQTFGPPLPDIAGKPLALQSEQPGDPLNGFTAALNGSTATVTATSQANQKLLITMDRDTGLLRNNRFAAGDAGYSSPFDFDSTRPGVQTLAASAASTVIIVGGNSDAMVLGSTDSAASSLLAQFQVTTDAAGSGSFTINDGARPTGINYRVQQNGNGLRITTADGSLNVTLQDNAFKNGFTLITGGSFNDVDVLATRAGEALTLDTRASRESVDIGDGDVQNILGDVIVTNTSPGGFTDLVVDNRAAPNAAAAVTVSNSSLIGLAPAAIRYFGSSIDDLTIFGGTSNTTYSLTGSLGGSTLGLVTGSGLDTVIVGNNGVVNDTFFPGSLNIQGRTQDRLEIDNSNGAAASVALTNQPMNGVGIGVVNGLTFKPIQFIGFATLGLGLGGSGNTFWVNSTTASPGKIDVTSAGDLTLAQSSMLGNNLDVSTTAGNVTVAGTIATGGGTLFVHTPDANNIQVNLTINTGPGSGGKVRTGSNVSPQQTNALYVPGAGSILLNAQGSITIVAGNPQTTPVGTTFSTPLQALVLDSHGNPVGSGVAVTFTAPGDGASGTFANHATTEIAVTNASGVATSSTFTANTTAGSYTVTASTAGIAEPASFSLTNAAPVIPDPTVAFITALYRDVLERDPDSQGMTNWVAFLKAGGTRQQVVAGFWDSLEHRVLQVDQFYATYLHRAADPAGRVSWVDRLLAGTSEAELANGFLTSQEYGLSHPSTSDYLLGLYADVLGRAADADGVVAWGRVAQGGLSRAALADGFLLSPEADLEQVNRNYANYLGRTGEAAGAAAWLAALRSGRSWAQLAVAFLACDEYFARARG